MTVQNRGRTPLPLPSEASFATPRPCRLSPLNRRRWDNFKKHRRGYISLWIFILLFTATLFAEFIANDKPLLVKFEGRYHMPILTSYPETYFGGEFETEADYRDPTVNDLITANGWALWPPIRYSYATVNYDLTVAVPSPPSTENWLGTDDQGRDVLARIVYGLRTCLLFGLLLTLASSLIGVATGAAQGYFGGWTDLLFQRFIEIWSAIPSLYLLIVISAVLEPGFLTLLGTLLLFSWMALTGVVRAEFLRGRNFEYVNAARALGLSNIAIVYKHLLPNTTVAALTLAPFVLSGAIVTLTSLDFLGYGMPSGSPSLGELLQQGKSNLQAPWLAVSGFFIIALVLALLIFIGEAMRDAFDPRETFRPS